jgi:uncharacterized protein (TIGR03083 family)
VTWLAELPAELLYAEIDASTAALAALVDAEEPSLPIPACPGWTLRQLATHVGRAHRWATEIVAARSADFIEFRAVPDGKLPDDPAEGGRWLTAGAGRLLDALREAGDDPVWAFGPLRPAGFWARRMAHETLVHCADAQVAAGDEVAIPPELAADAIDEWLTTMSGPLADQPDPRASALPAGTALRVHATDPELGGRVQWLVSHAADGVQVMAEDTASAGTGPAGDTASGDAVLAGRAADVLLVLMRRIPAADGPARVSGNAGLLGRWLEQTAF